MAKPKEGTAQEEAQEPKAEEKKEMVAGKGDKGDKADSCPFCDSSDSAEMKGTPSYGGHMQYHVACKNCGAMTASHPRPQHAMDHWNKKRKAKKGSGGAVYG